MPLFTPSTLVVTAAQSVVAESAGAQADTDMLTRALRALDATAQRWNRLKWKFLQQEQMLVLVAPFTVTGVSTTAGGTTITTSVAAGFASVLAQDMVLDGSTVFHGDTQVAATGSTALTLNVGARTTVTGATAIFQRAVYSLASDFKAVYDVRLADNPRPLFYLQRRIYDRLISDQQSAAATVAYELYSQGAAGQIRFIAPPAAADVAHIRYMRRISMPSSATAAVLDVPQDYEDVFLAAAKAYFLADKKEDLPRVQYWAEYARAGMAQIRSDEHWVPDELLALEAPWQGVYNYTNPNASPPWWDSFW